MITVIAIIMIMTGLVFANYRSGNQQFSLEMEAYRLAQDMRRVQENAMSAKELPGYEPGGYGVYVEQGDDYYLVFADTQPPDGNGVYETGDYVIETANFEDNVYVQAVSPGMLSVDFSPPDPTTTLVGTGGPVNQATITLGMAGTTKTKTVVINKAGLIYVQ